MIVLRMFRGRRTIALGFLMVGIAGTVLLEAPRARAEGPATAPGAELAALREQRIDTLRRAAGMARQMYQRGLLAFDEVLGIDRLLLEAQLESAATDKARGEILKKALAVAKELEDLVSKRERAGMTSPLDTLQATADRLHLEARLAELTAK